MSDFEFDKAMYSRNEVNDEQNLQREDWAQQKERLGANNIAAFIREMEKRHIPAAPFSVVRRENKRSWRKLGARVSVAVPVVESRGWTAMLGDTDFTVYVKFYITEDGRVVGTGEYSSPRGYVPNAVLFDGNHLAYLARRIIATRNPLYCERPTSSAG